jgi:polar amino acid transport system substrate-binding protein
LGLLIVAAVGACGPAVVGATAEPAASDSVQLTTGDNYAPFTGHELPEGGLTTSIVRHVFQAMHRDIAIEWLPWARGLYETVNGKYAATFPYIHTPDRDRQLLYSDPLYVIHETIFARPDSTANPAKLESLYGRTLCLPVGWAPAIKLEPLVRKNLVAVLRPKDSQSCARMVALHHADFFATDRVQGLNALSAAGIDIAQIRPLVPVLGATTLHLVASRNKAGSAALIAGFNEGLAALKRDGVYDQIVTPK